MLGSPRLKYLPSRDSGDNAVPLKLFLRFSLKGKRDGSNLLSASCIVNDLRQCSQKESSSQTDKWYDTSTVVKKTLLPSPFESMEGGRGEELTQATPALRKALKVVFRDEHELINCTCGDYVHTLLEPDGGPLHASVLRPVGWWIFCGRTMASPPSLRPDTDLFPL